MLRISPNDSISQTLIGSLITIGTTPCTIEYLYYLWVDECPLKLQFTQE